MDLVKKYIDLAEAWPGTPEYKKKFDPSYNPYDPEGKMRKALKQQPYGYRGKAADGEEETPAATPSVAKRGRPKTAKRVAEDVGSNDLLEYSEDLQKMRKADSYKVGDKIWTKVGGQWHKGHITTSLNKAGNHGVKFQHGGKTHSYVSSPDQLRLQVDEAQVHKVVKQEVEQLSELDKEPGGTLHRYLAKAGGPEGRQRRIKAAIDNPAKLKKINTGLKSAETKIEKERQKQTGMNPQYQRTPTAREIQMMDTRYTHEEYESMPASKELQKAHDAERKKRGLPDPKYYLDLAAKKKKEIEDMKKEEVELEEAQYGVNLGSRPISGQKEYQGKEIKSFHPNKEKEAREYAKKHGYVVKKRELPKGNNITHTWDIHKEEVEQIDEVNTARLATKGEYQKSLKTLEKMPEFKAMSKSLKRRDQDAEYDKRKNKEFIQSLKKSVKKEEKEPPFTPDKPKKPSALAGKYGAGYSTARHLARMGIKAALKDLKKGPEAGKRQVS